MVVARKKPSGGSPQDSNGDLPPMRPRGGSRPPLPLPPANEGHDEVDAEIAAATNGTNGQTDADGLTISHARSKSAPAIHNKNNLVGAEAFEDGVLDNRNHDQNGHNLNRYLKKIKLQPLEMTFL